MSRITALLVVATPDEQAKFLSGSTLADLRALAPEFRLVDPSGHTPESFARELTAFNPEVVVCGWSTLPMPATLPPRLRYVCYLTGGVRNLVTRGHLERGLMLTNWGSAISRTVAECALFHTLACLRLATRWTLMIHRDGGWRDGWEQAGSLFGRRVGIHGFGQVARAFLKLIEPFGCPVAICAPDVDEATAKAHDVTRAASLDALFADNDVIVELAPLNPVTRGIVTERHFRLIRPGGVFVNVGRAGVTDEAALLRVAREGQIAVGLDVFVDEPLPVTSGFRGLPNVSVTPHIAGPTLDRYVDATAHALRNLHAYAAGQPLEAVITPAMYDAMT